ncbi:hypothetical protein DC915_RS01610 [Vibrio parahaemolyticus]|nr:hypothetical protein [Vibrio parahaemolyticus]EJG0009669.1 hypothetical protein [Vibrio parahaemolyticus]
MNADNVEKDISPSLKAMVALAKYVLQEAGPKWHLFKYSTDAQGDPLGDVWGHKLTSISDIENYFEMRHQKYCDQFGFKVFLSVERIGDFQPYGLETIVIDFKQSTKEYVIENDYDMAGTTHTIRSVEDLANLMNCNMFPDSREYARFGN